MIDRFNLLALRLRSSLPDSLRPRVGPQTGQAFVEYVLVLTLVGIAVALITQWGVFTSTIGSSVQRVIDELNVAGK